MGQSEAPEQLSQSQKEDNSSEKIHKSVDKSDTKPEEHENHTPKPEGSTHQFKSPNIETKDSATPLEPSLDSPHSLSIPISQDGPPASNPASVPVPSPASSSTPSRSSTSDEAVVSESLTREELRLMVGKQRKAMLRYKSKITEVHNDNHTHTLGTLQWRELDFCGQILAKF